MGSIVSAAAPIIGGIIGNEESGDERRSARDKMSEAIGAFRDLKAPTIEEQRILLEDLKQQGVLTPELEQEILAGPSRFETITTAPELRDAQMSALQSLKEIGKGGVNAEDRAALNQIKLEAAREAKGREDAILQNMAQRGMGGSGQELAARLSASQGAADRASQEGDRLGAMMMQRKLAAIAQAGQLGGNIRGQEFGEQAQVANAADLINKFNTQNQVGTQQRNVGTRNLVQQKNLGEKQRVADTNVGLHNQQEIHNKGLYQQQFANNLARAQGLSGQLNIGSKADNAEAQRVAAMWAGIGKGVGELGGSIAGSFGGGGDGGGMMSGLGSMAGMANRGGQVPGEAKVEGDSPKNDTVPTMLSPGEVVVPRTVVAKGEKESAKFIKEAKEKHKMKHEITKASLSTLSQILKNLEEK